MRILIIAFGHPDNVFSLAHYLGEKTELTVLYVAVGKRFTRGVLDLKFEDDKYGYFDTEEYINSYFPSEIIRYAKNKFNIEVLRLPTHKILRDFSLRNFRLIKKTCNIIRNRKFTIVHYNGTSGFILFFRFLLKYIPQVWTLHDFKSHSGEENRKSEIFQRYLARNIDIIQHQDFLKTSLIENYGMKPDKVHLLYSGSLDVFKQYNEKKITNEKIYILFFGRISKYKGIKLLLEAYNKLENPGYKLIIAGSGKFNFDVNDYYKNKDIIIINRYIETEELVSLIKNSSFIVVPYSDATHSAVVATAYAFNKPVLAANTDGLSEVVIDNYTGKLFVKNSVDNLIENMKYMIGNKELLELFSKNIKEFKMNGIISWNKIIPEYLKVYNNLLSDSER